MRTQVWKLQDLTDDRTTKIKLETLTRLVLNVAKTCVKNLNANKKNRLTI